MFDRFGGAKKDDDESVEGREVPFGHPDADTIIKMNVQYLEVINGKCPDRCKHCAWPLQTSRDPKYRDFELGEICATCADIRSALMAGNPHLTSTTYFVNLHNDWRAKRNAELAEWKRKRREMGLDDSGIPPKDGPYGV